MSLIYGVQKVSLVDYPEHLACTIFLGGCNFCCPYCHNSTLIAPTSNTLPISYDSILTYLKKRQGLIEAVCISGGEPTLHTFLYDMICDIKSLGYLVKLDTNGSNPDVLRRLLSEDCLDYVAMDIKNDLTHYSDTVGIANYCTNPVNESASLLMSSSIAYEFRTTLVREFHTANNLLAIGKWLQGESPYYLQNYKYSEGVATSWLHGFSNEEMEGFRDLLLGDLCNVRVRVK